MADDEHGESPSHRVTQAETDVASESWKRYTTNSSAFQKALSEKLLEGIMHMQTATGPVRDGTLPTRAVCETDIQKEIRNLGASAIAKLFNRCNENHITPAVLNNTAIHFIERVQAELLICNDIFETAEHFRYFVGNEMSSGSDNFLLTLVNEARIQSAINNPVPIIGSNLDAAYDAALIPQQKDYALMNRSAELAIRGKRILHAIQNPICTSPLTHALPDDAVRFAQVIVDDHVRYHSDKGDVTAFSPAAMLNSNELANLTFDALAIMSQYCEDGRKDYSNMVKELRAGGPWYQGQCSKRMQTGRGHMVSQGPRYSITPTLGEDGVVLPDAATQTNQGASR